MKSSASEGSGTTAAAAKLAANRAASSAMLNSTGLEQELPRKDPESPGLRRRGRDPARAAAQPVAAPGQQPAHQARGPAADILVQAARRLQQDGRLLPR